MLQSRRVLILSQRATDADGNYTDNVVAWCRTVYGDGVTVEATAIGPRHRPPAREAGTCDSLRCAPAFRTPDTLALAAIALATLACLSPVHNDTWWHLAYGREMAERGGFAQLDRFSQTA